MTAEGDALYERVIDSRHALVRYWRLQAPGKIDLECRCGWRVYGLDQKDAREVFADHEANP